MSIKDEEDTLERTTVLVERIAPIVAEEADLVAQEMALMATTAICLCKFPLPERQNILAHFCAGLVKVVNAGSGRKTKTRRRRNTH